MTPSAQVAASRAVSVLTAAANRGGGSSGRLQTRARSTRMRPSAETSSPREQAADDVDRLHEPRVALLLRRPRIAGDVLVDRLAAAERRPEPLRVHLREGRDLLRGDRRVVALSRRGDDAEREVRWPRARRRASSRRSRSGPAGRSRARGGRCTSRRRSRPPRRASRPEQAAGRELFVRGVESHDRHSHSFRPPEAPAGRAGAATPCRAAAVVRAGPARL